MAGQRGGRRGSCPWGARPALLAAALLLPLLLLQLPGPPRPRLARREASGRRPGEPRMDEAWVQVRSQLPGEGNLTVAWLSDACYQAGGSTRQLMTEQEGPWSLWRFSQGKWWGVNRGLSILFINCHFPRVAPVEN
ncbi:UNVERIFIED_CONTAM: hypothetical protein K2H54_056735 [Gekko kuhli]